MTVTTTDTPVQSREDRAINTLLTRWQQGDAEARDRLAVMIYREIKAMAQGGLRGNRTPTFNTSDLAQEMFRKLFRFRGTYWKDKRHFVNTAACAMFQIIKDHAKVKGRKLHGQRKVDFATDGVDLKGGGIPSNLSTNPNMEKWMDLERAMKKLARINPQWRAIAVMKLQLGMGTPEIASKLALSDHSVKRKWQVIRIFLQDELKNWRGAP